MNLHRLMDGPIWRDFSDDELFDKLTARGVLDTRARRMVARRDEEVTAKAITEQLTR